MTTASRQMDKRFDPASYEGEWQRRWSEKGYFRARAPSPKEPFCIMIPPPNVTGKLHMGHALQSTLQDVMTRRKRMQGFNALWLPGTDHAGIATQLMVERQLVTEGTSRTELGREKFTERMWAWKKEYHGNIRRQLDLLGASCDWSRERFTLDEDMSRAVREAFVRLHEKGRITRGEYMVNWSPVLHTAISDLEVEMREVHGHLYHFAYPLEDSGERVVVATTRPETMLGDTAVAIHPDDDRYRHLLGKHVILPLVERRIPVIADRHVDPEFGTGLVKVTPFHDPNDFEIAQRHDLPAIQVIDELGRMTEAAGEEFAGLDRFEARELVLGRMKGLGLLERIEEHTHNVGHSQRSGEPVEPMLSLQWFCDVSDMARRSLEAVERGDLELVPDSWDKTWEHWLTNIRPWCISRQLWWGHRIPAWYDPDGNCFVARSVEEAAEQAGTDELIQDPDVLDTWFSSGLWPFSTLGWPDDTEDMRTFYPTQVLITGFDILFFWVARMVMMGLEFTDRVPFRTVHLTGLVRDARGEKMSKTRGNVLDPAELVEEYGADAMRFTLAALDSPGRDIPLDPERMAGYRAFGNKIWNATRFALSRIVEAGEARVQAELDPEGLSLPERWILSRVSHVAAEVNAKLEIFRFDEACSTLYHFFWGELCDWYIELSKPALQGEAPRPRVGEVLLTVLDRALRLLHPVMPHLTEELWQRLPGVEIIHPETIVLAPYPEAVEGWRDPEAEEQMGVLTEVIARVRSLRSDLGIAAGRRVGLFLEAHDETLTRTLEAHAPLVRFLLRVDSLELSTPPAGSHRDVVRGVELGLEVEVDRAEIEKKRERLETEMEKLERAIERARARLANPQFLDKAPADVVDASRAQLSEMEERYRRMQGELEGDVSS